MSAHTRVNLAAIVDYECAFSDCGHETRPCPTMTVDACKECSDRSMSEYEGGVVYWSECNGRGENFEMVPNLLAALELASEERRTNQSVRGGE